MKIRALRLAEVGPFRQPVAIEGFSGGLDVLTGPNEAGKSTLFAALATLLSERHTTTSRGVAALRPDAGGAPLIEADFEVGVRRLRLRKRFLAQRLALLEDLGSGEVWHGADAEAAAQDLLGGNSGQAMRGLLWVAQGDSFELPPKPDATLAGSLAALIEREVADVAGAGAARRLADAVRARLETLVTLKQGKAKAGSPLDQARRRRDELGQLLHTARAKAAAAEARLERRAALRAERDRLASPEAAAAFSASAHAARRTVEAADTARQQLQLSGERVATRQLAHDQARAALERFSLLAEEGARLATAIETGRVRLDELVAARATAEERAATLQAGLASLDEQQREAHRKLAAAQEARMRAAALAELETLDRRLAAAEAVMLGIARAEADVESNRATEALVEKASRLASRIEALDARIDAASPWADIAYLPAGRGRIRIAGTALADDARITIGEPIKIEIEGVGTITVSPGQSDGAALTAERTACRDELAIALAAAGARDIGEAHDILGARRRAETALAEGRGRLAALAPQGLDVLAAERARAASRAGDGGGEPSDGETDVEVLTAQVRTLGDETKRQRAHAAAAELELRQLATAIGGLETRLAGEIGRAGELAAELPRPEQRETHRGRLATIAGQAASDLAEAVRERSAWAEKAPSGAAYDALVAKADGARSVAAMHAERCADLGRELAALDGALHRDSEDGVGAEIAGLEQGLAAAEARVADLEIDVEALGLIAARLGEAGSAHRDTVLRPLVDRLDPLLGQLLPGARLAMEGPLLAVRLDRTGRNDPLGRVSGGTREQVATLVRLAYADLAASRGEPMPVVLDDALVFSDDQRLETMIAMLAAAGARHQVVLLSCHQRALDPLVAAVGANRLAIEPWEGVVEAASRSSGPRHTKPAFALATGILPS